MCLLVFFLKKFSIKHCPRHQIIHPEWKATGTVGHEQRCKATDKDSTQVYSPGVYLCKLGTHKHTHTQRKYEPPHMVFVPPYKHTSSRENCQLYQCWDNEAPLVHSRICLSVLYLLLFNKVEEVKFNKHSISFKFLRQTHSKCKWKDKINGPTVFFKH